MKISTQISFTGGRWIVSQASEKAVHNFSEAIYPSSYTKIPPVINNAKDFFTSSNKIGSNKIAILNYTEDDLRPVSLEIYAVVDKKVKWIAEEILIPRNESQLEGKGVFYNWLNMLAEAGMLK